MSVFPLPLFPTIAHDLESMECVVLSLLLAVTAVNLFLVLGVLFDTSIVL